MLGKPSPPHPLITVIESTPQAPLTPAVPVLNVKFVSDLYTVSLKQGTECALKYGRQPYDCQEGSLMFLAPGQAVMPVESAKELNPDMESWTLMFHPELLRGFPLAERMASYSFFEYDSNEALHLSTRERELVTGIVRRMQEEYEGSIDTHAPELIVSNLELLLNYCKRFYGRQFRTRTGASKDAVVRFDVFLRNYFESDMPEQEGVPTVQRCAREVGCSASYLSDLLKEETGRTAREQIHHAVVEKAKTLLLGSNTTVAEIAYALGFEYPQHFSTLFKRMTGVSPAAYRN